MGKFFRPFGSDVRNFARKVFHYSGLSNFGLALKLLRATTRLVNIPPLHFLRCYHYFTPALSSSNFQVSFFASLNPPKISLMASSYFLIFPLFAPPPQLLKGTEFTSPKFPLSCCSVRKVINNSKLISSEPNEKLFLGYHAGEVAQSKFQMFFETFFPLPKKSESFRQAPKNNSFVISEQMPRFIFHAT